jgi:hypothetical protein
MANDQPALIAENAAERSLANDVRQLASDGRTLLEAELAYQKSRAVVAGQAAKGVAGWGALALAMVFFALMALVLGLVLVLAEAIGALWATITAFLTLLAIAALCGWIALRRWQRAAAQLADAEAAP